METVVVSPPTRLPRFRRASEPPALRLTDDDVTIIRQLARYRFLRSTHIAALIGRSLDRTNDRLAKLFHAGYLDRPRAQLDYYPTSGSAPIAYALADRGARLLVERYGVAFANLEWSRKNREAGRPFIEHQLEVTDFCLALQLATGGRTDLRVIHADELIAAFPEPLTAGRNPFSMKVKMAQRGVVRERAIVPDLAFGLAFPNGSHRHFMVEIDLGTMPIIRSNLMQTSFEQKSRSGTVPFTVFGWPRRTPILARDFLGAERMTVPKRVQSGTVQVYHAYVLCAVFERPHNRADSGTIAGVQKLAHQGHLLHRGNYSFDHLSLFERTVSPSGNRL
ncbi:MAG: replication-relaxation family protein [Xanthobacteraceae bacterium]